MRVAEFHLLVLIYSTENEANDSQVISPRTRIRRVKKKAPLSDFRAPFSGVDQSFSLFRATTDDVSQHDCFRCTYICFYRGEEVLPIYRDVI